MFKRYLKRFPPTLAGLYHAATKDFGFRTQLYLGGLVLLYVIVFLLPLTITEFVFIFGSYLLVLITELQNSALEATLDKLHPERSETIKTSKDLAAASVLVAGALLAVVLLLLTLVRMGWI